MRRIAFLNQKGGVGKTTTAVNVASLLAHEHGKRVLAVDLDTQCNLSDHFGIDPNDEAPSLYHVLIDRVEPRTAIRSVHGLDVLPANRDMPGVELQLAHQPGVELRLRDSLEAVAGAYDFVLLDCPPSLGLLTLLGLVFAREVVVPMEAEYLALRGLSQLVETVEAVRERMNPDLAVTGVVFCKFDGRTHLARDVRTEVEAWFPGRVFATSIRRNVRLAEAPSHGHPVDLYDAACAGTEDYRALTAEILARAGAAPGPLRQPQWRGDEA